MCDQIRIGSSADLGRILKSGGIIASSYNLVVFIANLRMSSCLDGGIKTNLNQGLNQMNYLAQ